MRLPQQVGEYRFVERLGGGAFGTVYRAEISGELGYRQDCAVKLIDPGRAADDPEEVAALADEARILSRLHHPTIVHVRRFVQLSHQYLGDTWGLEMELVRGATLDLLIERQEELTIPAIVLILTELLDGLQYAHMATDPDGRPLGLVHRDLKPENIVVTYEGRVKLLDFGIARAHGRIGMETSVGETKGTPLYMSPEQLRGEPLDGTSDLYALGALAFELLTPQRFVQVSDDITDVSVVLMAVSETFFEERRPVLEKCLAERKGLTEKQARKLVAWLGRLLAEEPEFRTPTAADALDELSSIGGLVRPHRSRELLKSLVHQVRPPEELHPAASQIVSGSMPSVGVTQLVASTGEQEQVGRPSEWIVGDQPLETPSEATDIPRWLPILVAVLVGTALIMGAVSLIGDRGAGEATAGGDPSTGVRAEADAPIGSVPDPADGASAEAGLGEVEASVGSTDAVRPAVEDPTPAPPEPTPEPVVAASDPTPTASEATPKPAMAAPDPTPAPPEPTPEPAVAASDPTPKASTSEGWGTQEPAVLVAPDAGPGAIVHTPPTVAVAGSPLRFKVSLDPDDGACTPRVHWGPRGGAIGSTAAFSRGGGAWTATVSVPYDQAHAGGIQYHLDCCTEAGACSTWRSAADPQRVSAPDF